MSGNAQLISGISANTSAQVVAGTVQGSVYFGDNESWRDSPINRLPYAVEAPFNAYDRQHEPTCLPETRLDILQEIYAWADGNDGRFIFWLNGLAGTGKSTIARTVARKYFETDQLGASFFFSRGSGDVGQASKFFTTIAVQLASKSEPLQRHICDAIKKNSNIATQSLGDQWRQLILGPLSKLDAELRQSSYVFVIDALDECDNENDIRIILRLLAEARSLEAVWLRVLLTSRPETSIRHGLYQLSEIDHHDFVLHHISPSIVDHDIMTFLKHNFGLIGQKKPSLGVTWPGEETVKQLVHNANGLFIWAATAIRFIQEAEKVFLIRKRLATTLQAGITIGQLEPERHLDEIYTTVLGHCIPAKCSEEDKEDYISMLRTILGSIAILLSPLSVDSLSRLLNIQPYEIDDSLEDLHAILDVSGDRSRPLRLHHPSFRDFLLNQDRCSALNFWVDEKHTHKRLAGNCMQLLSTFLKEDICSVRAPGTDVHSIQASQLEHFLPLEVQYACLYWVEHLRRGGAQLRDNDDVDQFLRTHFLHWLEALSWMQKISEGILEIISLESITPAASCPNIFAFITDMKRFVLHNRAGMEQAPLQLYCSALLFMPVMSLVRKQFVDKMPRWIKRGPEVESHWGATLQNLESDLYAVRTIAFSPSGQQLASGSADSTVRIWDVVTGATLQILEGHLDSVEAIAFLPDGKRLVSGSDDKTVRVWDVAMGVTLQVLEGHLDSVIAFALPPDNKHLVSGSIESTRVWDLATGATLQILLQIYKGDPIKATAIAFSPDGKQQASGYEDGSVFMTELTTGAALPILKGPCYITVLVFSPDGKQLASGFPEGTVQVWDTATGAVLHILDRHSDAISALAYSADGKQLASGSQDGGTVRVWDPATGAISRTFESHSYSLNAIAFSLDGKQLACCSGFGSSYNGMQLPCNSGDAVVRVWDAATIAAPKALNNHFQSVTQITFSPDGKQLAFDSSDNTVRVWNAATGATSLVLEGHLDNVTSIAFSSDGKQLASGSNDKTIRVWNTTTGATLVILKGHLRQIGKLAFSPDGKQLASSAHHDMVRVWDLVTGATLQIFESEKPVAAIAFSPDGKQLAFSSGYRTAIWDASTGETLGIFHTNEYVTKLSYFSDGSILTDRGRLDEIAILEAAVTSSVPILIRPSSPSLH